MKSFLPLILLALLAGASTGCSSFHSKWKTALNEGPPSNAIAGPWEGSWVSGKNGHKGRLRCVMTETGTNSYNAHFHATFWKVFRAAYEVPFAVIETGDHFQFSGQSDLGKLAGGVYTYNGTASHGDFDATYVSKYDHGRFIMKRPTPDTAE